jgi:photosynthetic reaction center cytochrome c subunit
LGRILSITAVTLVLAATSRAAETPRKTPSPEIPAEKFYKNIQVLQGTPSTGIMPAMKFMADSLGVRCSYCHVTNDTGRWPVERDDKAAKGRAREMIVMTREINRSSFKGRLEVTCSTCHRGAIKPVATPPMEAPASAHANPVSSPGTPEPSVDAVLEKYVAAVGGNEALSRVSSRRVRGTIAQDGETHPIEFVQTADGRYRTSTSLPEGTLTTVFDGEKGWEIGPSWKNPLEPDEIERIRSEERLFPAANLKARFSAVALFGREDVGGRSAFVVRARDREGREERFYLDARDGLLLRTQRLERTPLGDIPEQTDYSDYREVDGVKVPFSIRHAFPGREDTLNATEVAQNGEISAALFESPGSDLKP